MSIPVTATSGEGLAVTNQARAHRLVPDEPADSGGTDTGPDPSGLLPAAPGTCTAMTLHLYARRKGWPRAHVTVCLQ
ncbi:MAG: OsmC family protein [candidate division NC10 bacterium]|nr:OsmC family protein [candidate division NC10 bacterium]